MERLWAQINQNGQVENVIVADQSFVDAMTGENGAWKNIYQLIEVTSLESRPEIGWTYDGTFRSPEEQ